MSTRIKGVSSMKNRRELGVTQKTAWLMTQKIREGWDFGSSKLEDEVEVDESYFGWKESNKHLKLRNHAGRAAVSKEVVVGIKQRNGQIPASHVRNTTAQTLQGMIQRKVKAGFAFIWTSTRAIRGSAIC